MERIIVPASYDRLFEILEELFRAENISNILEIGCGDARFVKFLREQGRNAFGLEYNGTEESQAPEYTQVGAVGKLGTAFDGTLFDLICANRVMSETAMMSTIQAAYGAGSMQVLVDFAKKAAPVNNQGILTASHDRLRPGGFFVAAEIEPDELAFQSRDAENLGYKVQRYSPQSTVLQKPI